METKRTLRIVVASPGDVQPERDVLPVVVDELNRGIAAEHGLYLELSRWETDSYPGFHAEGPQGLIDTTLRIEDSDVLIGIFWKRFGTPTLDAQSGTEHEILLAHDAWRRNGSPQIMVYFNQKPHSQRSEGDSDQWENLLAFRNRFPKEGLFWSYRGTSQFERLVRNHLTQFIRQRFSLANVVQVIGKEPKGRELKELLTIYRKNLRDRVSKVFVVGENEPRELEKVFIDLDVMDQYRHPSSHNEFLGLMDRELRRKRSPFEPEEYYADYYAKAVRKTARGGGINHKVKPDELLRECTHVIITGAPGCGKTTLLRYLALKTLTRRLLPIFLELKTVSKADFEDARNDLAALLFEKCISKVLHLRTTDLDKFRESFLASLRAGEVAILLDGLDEVRGTTFFSDLCTAVGEFVRSDYRNNTLVISTRPYAFPPRLEGLKEMEIAPLTLRQVEEFVSHYYGDTANTKQFLKQLRSNRSLSELCSVPFLLSTILQLHHTENQIAVERLELYRQIVLHLAIKLDSEKSLPLTRFYVADPDGTLKLDFMKYLACERLLLGYANEEGTDREASRLVFSGDLILRLAKLFLQKENLKEINPSWLAADVKATPLLREIGADVYAFAHLTIQEYLTAVALSHRDDCENVLCRAYFNPTLAGMEVFPMLLGLANKPYTLYLRVEQLAESLTLTNLRLRARALSYLSSGTHLRQILTVFTKRLLDVVTERNVDETPYRDLILRDLSTTTRTARDFITARVSVLLSNKDPGIRKNAAEALWKMGGANATPSLLGALKDKDSNVRYHAALALGLSENHRAVVPLCKALNDKEELVGMYAASALGKIGGDIAIDALLGALTNETENVRRNATRALAEIGDERGVAGLFRALSNDNSFVRGDATRALGEVGGSVLDRLLDAASDKNRDVRSGATEALGLIGDERAVAALIVNLKDQDSHVRVMAVRALGRIGSQQALGALFGALKDEDMYVRQNALWELWPRRAEAVFAYREALLDKNYHVYLLAAEILAETGDQDAFNVLLRAMENEDWHIRVRATQALARLGTEEAFNLLVGALTDDNKSVRLNAAEGLVEMVDERARDPLIKALNDEWDAVRGAAADALGKLGDERAISPLLEQLGSEGSLRWHTMEALGRIGSESAVIALLGAITDGHAARALELVEIDKLSCGLIKALSGDNDTVRRKAVEVVGYYSHEVQVLEKLTNLAATDPAHGVRKSAAKALVKYEGKLRLFDLLKD